MVATRERDPGVMQWGDVAVPGLLYYDTQGIDDVEPGIHQGPPSRADRSAVRAFKLQTAHKGLGVIRGSEVADNQRLRFSELSGHIPGFLGLPYVQQTQSALTATDISGFRALNLRWHPVNSTIGQSKQRPYFGLGKKLYRGTSDSDHSLADSGYTVTDNITGMWESKAASTSYLLTAHDNTTNDVQGTTDPTASPPTFATIFALAAGDWGGSGYGFPLKGGGFDVHYMKYAAGGSGNLFYRKHGDALLTAPVAIVDHATRNVPNPSNASVSITKSVGTVFQDNSSADQSWANMGNARTSDDAYVSVTSTSTDTDESGKPIYLLNFGFSIPTGSIPLGVQADFEVSVNATNQFTTRPRFADVTAEVGDVRMIKDGAIVAASAKTDSTTFTATDATISFGSSSDLWTIVGPSDFSSDDWGFVARVAWRTANQAGDAIVRLDHMQATVTYIPPGTPLSLPAGGYIVGPDPFDADSLYIVAPVKEELTSVNVPRVLWKLTVNYDAEGDRLTGTLTRVPTGLSHVEAVAFAMAEVCCAGDTISGVAKALKSYNGSLLRDLGFGAGQGYANGAGTAEAWGIVNLYGADRYLYLEVANEGATKRQSWIYADGALSPVSKIETIAALPIAKAGAFADLGVELRRRYTFYPATTNTAVTRQFQPRNPLTEPLRSDTAEVKEDGVLTAVWPDMDALGGEEANKALLVVWCLSRDVSATSTIRFRYSTDGGATFTTWTTFTSYGSKAALSPPVLGRSFVFEIGLTHTAGSADTPNGLPLLIEGYSSFRALRRWTFNFNTRNNAFRSAYMNGVEGLWDELVSEYNELPTQTLQVGNDSIPAAWKPDQFKARSYAGPTLGERAKDAGDLTLVFDEVAQ